MNYLFLILLLVVSGASIYLSVKLLLAAKESRLYNTVSFMGLVGVIPGVIYAVSQFFEHDMLLFLMNLAMSIWILIVYFLWRVTYNRISKDSYTYIIVILIVLSIGIDFMVYKQSTVLSKTFYTLSKHQILNNIVLAFITLKYFQFSKMNNTMELNFVSLVLLAFLLSKITATLQVGPIVSLFTVIQSACVMMILYFYTKDYKRSFYY